jgi:FtsZ-interacting cell division protein ZipA
MDTLTTKPKTCRRRAIKNKDKKTVAIDQPDIQEFHGLVLPDPVENFGEVAFANGKLVYESFVFQNELGLECLVKDEPVEQPIEPVEQPVETVERPVETVEQPVETVEQPVETVEQPVEPVEQPVETVEQPVEQPVERIKCTCGSIVTKKSLTKHLKTAKHLHTC